jgi:CRISPR-associated endonuclease/helicase Cas3
VYGTALAATWAWLQARAADGIVDFGVDAMPTPIDGAAQPGSELLARVSHAPVLLPAQLDAWAQTSPPPSQDPDVSLWLHGPRRELADVQIVWRADISDEQSDEECEAQLFACRPSTLESVTVPLAAARGWLDGITVPIADVVAVTATETPKSQNEGAGKRAFRWTGDIKRWVNGESLRPGDVLVVPAARGGLGAGTFDPDDKAPVIDLGDLVQLRGRGVASLRLTPPTLACWGLGSDVESAAPLPEEDESSGDLRIRISDWLDSWPTAAPLKFSGTSTEWADARAAFADYRSRPLIIAEHFVLKTPLPRKALGRVVELDDSVTEDDDSSFREAEVTLAQHSTDVRDYAERFARSVGFSPSLVADIAHAAWLHDVGKVDPRFQRWLLGGVEVEPDQEPLAKSSLPAGSTRERNLARERAGYPKGYRHELLSLAMIRDNANALVGAVDKDLVLHLVASHHGWCRPFAPPVDHPDEIAVNLDHRGMRLSSSTRHRLARLDSGVSDRFWGLVDRYGWWGLAWLEAVMRLADHRASEMEAGGAS